jgi:hypothetical protein
MILSMIFGFFFTRYILDAVFGEQEITGGPLTMTERDVFVMASTIIFGSFGL